MGAGGARSGGGGSGVPNMIRPPKVRRKEIFKEKISKIKTPATAILKGIGEQIKKGKEERAADKFLGTADYQGSPTGRKSRVKPTGPRGEGPDGRANEYRPPVKIIKPKTPKPITPKPITPTTAEVSQTTATTAEAPVTTPEEIAETEEERKRKTKRRGRSLMVITSPQGVNEKLTLGKPSLLGS